MAEFSFTYRAFISYAHADHKWAVWLHRALERYRVPRRLAGAEGVKRLGKCFRDEEELAAAAELGPKIAKALQSSDVLIVVCSRRSAKSKWVNQEIEAFKRQGREHRVFALIVDGEPHGAQDAAGNPTECFPEALKRTAAGGVAEPLAVDVRKFGREDAAVRLIAGMLDVGYDDLRQREVRRRRGELLRAQAILVAGMLLTIGALTGGYFAASNYVDASETRSELFAFQAKLLSAEGDNARAMLIALAGDPAAQAGWLERFLRPKGYLSAQNALLHAYTHNRLQDEVRLQDGDTVSGFTRDGEQVELVSADGSIAMAPISSGSPTVRLRNFDSGRFHQHQISRDGAVVLGGSWDGTALVQAMTAAVVFSQVHVGDGIQAVAVSPDGQIMAVGINSGSIVLWNRSEDKVRATLRGHTGPVRQLSFSPDGSQLLSAADDGTTRLWSVTDGVSLKVLAQSASYGAIGFSENGQRIFSVSNRKPIAMSGQTGLVWAKAGRELAGVIDLAPGDAGAAAISHDGQLLLTGSYDGAARLWQVQSGKKLAEFAGQAELASVAFSSDSQSVVTGGEGVIRRWSVYSQKPQKEFAHGGMDAIAFSPDGKWIAGGSEQGAVKLWSVEGGETRDLVGHERTVSSVSFSPDGRSVLTSSHDGSARLWSLDGKVIRTIANVDVQVFGAAFSADGRVIISRGTEGVGWLWDAKTGAQIRRLEPDKGPVQSIALSPDGQMVLLGLAAGSAELRPIDGGAPVARFSGHQGVVYAVAFSPDGKLLVTASLDGSAKLWRVQGGPAVATFQASTEGGLLSAAFSPSSKFFVTGSLAGHVKVWSISGGEAVASFESDGPARSVAFSPDGRHVASGPNVRMWSLPEVAFVTPGELTHTACEKLRDIGVTEFSDSDYQRFPILDRNAPHPCAKVWGVDPRAKGQGAAASGR